MFVRIKKRKNHSGKTYKYAYLVKTKYLKKGPRQRILQYLGRLYEFKKESDKDQKTLKKWPESLKQLIEEELANHYFKEEKEVWKNHTIEINFKERKIEKDGQKVCLKFNNGFLCDFTLSLVLDFQIPKTNEKGIGKSLGNTLLLAGIGINPERFIELFNQIREEIGLKQW